MLVRGASWGGTAASVLLTTVEQPVPPVDEVASVLCTEQAGRNHHPKPNEGERYEIFGTGYDFTRHGVEFSCDAETICKTMKRNSTQPVQKSRPPKNPPGVWRLTGEYAGSPSPYLPRP